MTDFQPKLGDRTSLAPHEVHILEEKVLPTARRWLREYPQLAHHAVTTLSFWGEPLVDDMGRPYTPHGR